MAGELGNTAVRSHFLTAVLAGMLEMPGVAGPRALRPIWLLPYLRRDDGGLERKREQGERTLREQAR